MQKSISEQPTCLTMDKLRTFPGYENMPDEELAIELDSIIRFAEIIAAFAASQKFNSIDYQQVVYLDNKNKAA